MSPVKTEKKRKAATASTAAATVPPSKKSKKEEKVKVSTELPKKKAVEASGDNGVFASKSLKLNGEAARKIKPRKRAADFLSDDESDDDAGAKLSEVKNPPVADKTKSSKKKSKKEVEVDTPAATGVEEAAPATGNDEMKSQKGKKDKSKKEEKAHKKEKSIAEPASDIAENAGEGENEAEGEDDQTVALIKGFESSGDEDNSDDEGYETGKSVPTIPDSKKTKKKLQKLAKKRDTPDEPGTVYVGRIPHGFYEQEMKAYFSQFGPITKLRLSRNRVTGRSKHYAFIEFASASVARVVASTMDNYLMFGHILKCRFVPEEQIHPDLWKGANRRFNRTPWNRVEQFRLEGGKSREKWSKSIAAEKGKRASKAEKMKALGYELKLPTLKGLDEVPVQERRAKLKESADATGDSEETKEVDETEAIDTAKADDTEKETTGKSKKKAEKIQESTKSAEKAEQVKEPEKEPEADDTPKSERKKRAAETEAASSGISKKAKKATSKDADVTASEKSSRKTRRESAGDEEKPAKVKKGDKTKTKVKAKA